ncbi:hypothetical protein [Massilia sp. CT11-137]|uniref:hypothetical protein n=1 Tax=Massilia sp. CT11-137 TaxID=3393901 RepID=UPI0039A51403
MAWRDEKYADLSNEGKKVVAVRSDWARELGQPTAAWLAQALFAQRHAGAGRWWFKKLLAERDQDNRMLPPQSAIEQSFEYETGLTRSQQETARKILRKLGILSERRCRWQRRLEYMINLDRLCEFAREWAHAERATARTGTQDCAVLGDKSNAQESEIPRSSTESIQNFKKSSRNISEKISDSRSLKSLNASHPGYRYSAVNRKRRTIEPGGVHCWTDDDRELANSLLEQHGEEKVRGAVMKVEESCGDPYPLRVSKLLSNPKVSTAIDQASEFIRKHDIDKSTNETRAAGRKAMQMLSDSEREAFIPIYIAQLGTNQKTTFDPSTRRFLNRGEKLQYDRWLEKRLTLGQQHCA